MSRAAGTISALYLIEILHQTTTLNRFILTFLRCILSKFYIKPQHFDFEKRVNYVVSYRNSTSNHNSFKHAFFQEFVVSYRNSTSNHNCHPWLFELSGLYLIEILHQTTTKSISGLNFSRCILSKFYIKPQRKNHVSKCVLRCILSKFYIKPQLWW